MKYGSPSNEDEPCLPPRPVPSVVTRKHLDVVPVVLFLLFFLFVWLVDAGDVYAASQGAFVPACMPSTGTTSTPTATPAPTSAPILLPNPISSPTPPSSPDQERIEKRVWHYITLVFAGRYQEAYAMVSPDEQAQEPYCKFLHDKEFTLLPGCWMVGQDFVSQPDSQTWEVGVEMTQVFSCIDGSSKGISYYWRFRMRLQNGQSVIVWIGLYPTAPGC